MIIGTCEIYMRAEWVSSLKEKRMIVKSIVEKIRHKFNVSVAEVGDNDMHKSIVIGFACVTNEARFANSVIDNVINFIEENTEAEIVDTVIEIL